MQPRVQLITLGVPDLDAARHFYVDGLRWPVIFEVPGEIVFLQVGHGLALGLWDADKLAADAGDQAPTAVGTGAPAPLSLAQIVASEAEVVEALDRAVAAGGTLLKPGQHADFGGFHGYVADPAGFRWEIAHNPGWHEADDGTVSISPIG
jgi:uncharacterized protein